MPGRRTLAIVALLAASALCVATVEIRTHETGDSYYRFLVWNLILAWVPLGFAVAAYSRARRQVDALVWVLLVPWLLFFPNAPYLLTDFIHLGEGPAPLWYDALMLSAFAWTGLLLGFVSVYLVQQVAARMLGPAAGWLTAVGALGLSGLGIYLGRHVRLNSWDLLLQPQGVVADVLDGLTTLRMLGMSLVMATFLTVAYGMLYTFLQAALDERD